MQGRRISWTFPSAFNYLLPTLGQHIYILWPYKVITVNMLVKSCQFTHPAKALAFISSHILILFYLCFGRHQVLRAISVFLACKSSTMFTCWSH